MITISRKSLQQFKKCKPVPFIAGLNFEYFDQPGLQEENARLLEYFIKYLAPTIREVEVADLSAKFVEQTRNTLSILEEISTNCLLSQYWAHAESVLRRNIQ